MSNEKTEFIKFNTIKEYIKSVHDFRSDKESVEELILQFSSLIEKVIIESIKLAKEEKRTTVLLKDVKIMLERFVGKERLYWEDILKGILIQNPTDLGKISKGIKAYIKEIKTKAAGIDSKALSLYLSREFNLTKSTSEKIVKHILDEILK